MLPFMTPVFLQIGLGFSPFHAGLMMIPMVLGSMGMKRIVVQVVNRFGYRRVLVASTLGLAAVSLLFMFSALAGWYYVLPLVLFLQGMINASRFSSMNTLTLKDLPDDLAQQRQQPAVDGDAAVDEYRRDHRRAAAGAVWPAAYESSTPPAPIQVFLYTYLSMAAIIALPALIFSRVPDDVGSNTVPPSTQQEWIDEILATRVSPASCSSLYSPPASCC